MPQKIVDFYNVRPYELEPGNVLVSTVTCHISHIDEETDTVYIAVYRCKYPPDLGMDTNIPQGIRLGRNEMVEVAKALFPVLLSFKNVEVL